MQIVNATNFRKKTYEYLASAVDLNDIITVTTKTGNAVVMSEEEYNGIKETLHLLSVPGMREKLLKGMDTPVDECVELDWKNEL